MKILITGAAGYIGSLLAEKLSTQDLLLVDDYSACTDGRPKIEKIGRNHIVEADISSEAVCQELLKGIDVIYHFAATSGIAKCEDPASYKNNVVGTSNIGAAALRNGCRKIIFASTSAVYGESQCYFINENHRIKPRCKYGWEKYIGELILQSLGIPIVILRKSNVYGDGLFHKKTAVDVFIDKAMNGEDITIDGTGLQRRDYVHLNDTVDAYIQSLYWDSGVYNIGGLDNMSVNELADIIISYVYKSGGKLVKKIFNEQADAGRMLKKFSYDITRAMSIGYKPKERVINEVTRRVGGHRCKP